MAVQKAYERLQSGFSGGQGPQPWRLLLLLKVIKCLYLSTFCFFEGIEKVVHLKIEVVIYYYCNLTLARLRVLGQFPESLKHILWLPYLCTSAEEYWKLHWRILKTIVESTLIIVAGYKVLQSSKCLILFMVTDVKATFAQSWRIYMACRHNALSSGGTQKSLRRSNMQAIQCFYKLYHCPIQKIQKLAALLNTFLGLRKLHTYR